MNRRTFLKAASTAGAMVLAGCGDSDPVQEIAPTRTAEEPASTPDPSAPTETSTETSTAQRTPTTTESGGEEESALRDVTMDVSGGHDVANIVDGLDGGERLVFPPGRYTWASEAVVTADDWGIRCQDGAVFEIPVGMGDDDRTRLLRTTDNGSTADNVHLENLAFDSEGRAAPSIHIGVRNTGHVDGLQYRMNGPLTDRRHENGIRAFVENDDGRLRIDNYRQFNNGDLGAYGRGDSRIGIWVGSRNQGTIHLRNPVLQGFPNNACYVSRQPGTVIIEDGLLLNNNVSAVRVSGGVEVRDTTVYIDIDRYRGGPGRIRSGSHNTRGFWGDNRQAGTDGGLVTGVSCILKSYHRSTGLVTILENPHMTVRDSQFLLDTSIESVRAHNGEIAVVDCQFDGRSLGSTAGVGDITGSGGHVAPIIEPGAVPVQGTDATFDWSRTHPETPERPTYDCPSLAEFFTGDRLPVSECGSQFR